MLVELFNPAELEDDAWERLDPFKCFAVLCDDKNPVYLRLGRGRGVFLTIQSLMNEGRVIKTIEYENGNMSPLAKLANFGAVSLGRSSDVSVKIVSPIVSRRHLELSLDGNILVIMDSGSMNGTYIYSKNVFFSVDDYLSHYSLEESAQKTLDQVHETFGLELDEFFKRYLAKKENTSHAVPTEPQPDDTPIQEPEVPNNEGNPEI